jgi:CHASE2 domain-containing sensor protein
MVLHMESRMPPLFFAAGLLAFGLAVATLILAIENSWAAVVTGLVASAAWLGLAQWTRRRQVRKPSDA